MSELEDLLANDPREFLRRLLVGAERGRELAAARPGLIQVGNVMQGLHDGFRTALWAHEGGDGIERPILRPTDEAPGAIWDPSTSGSNGDNALVLEIADGYATAVRDHSLAFARLAQADGPMRSLLALARVLMDASVHLSFLVEEGLSERDRCRRALNIRFEALRQELADVDDKSEEAESLRTERAALMDAAGGDGFERAMERDKRTGREREGWFVAPRERQDDLASKALGTLGIENWRTLSSVVHAQERKSVRFPLGLDTIHPGPHATQMSMLYAAPPLLAAIAATREAISYYRGEAAVAETEASRERALAVLQFASGVRDDVIRQRLGHV